MVGQVVRVISGYYDILSNGKEYRTRGAGRLRNNKVSPLVGDIVEFSESGLLENVLPRRNELIRPKVANIDQAIIVTSLRTPDFSSALLDKMLAIIEYSDIDPILVFTKTDLNDEDVWSQYEKMNYKIFKVSNIKLDREQFGDIFKNKLSVFIGQTGAGKSSLINNLSQSNQEVGEVSKALGRGKHTTRVVEIIEWNGGQLIDTPGFSSIEFPLTKLQLSKSFKQFKQLAEKCKFPKNCLHDKEEDCEIKRAVLDGRITNERYMNYLKMLKEI